MVPFPVDCVCPSSIYLLSVIHLYIRDSIYLFQRETGSALSRKRVVAEGEKPDVGLDPRIPRSRSEPRPEPHDGAPTC